MKRVKYIDTAKGYLMILVVIGHVLIVLNPDYDKIYFTAPQAFIYTFHMPAFFLLHGIVFNMDKWREQSLKLFVLRKLQTLMIPYCFFEVLGIIWRKLFFNQSLVTGLYNMVTMRCNVGADWFLPAMFLGSLLLWIYVKNPNRIYAIVTTVASFLFPMFMNGNQFRIVLGRGLLAYAFIMCGCIFKSLFLNDKVKSVVWFTVSLMVTAIVAVFGLRYGGNDFYSCTVQNPLALWIGGMSGSVLIIGISRILHCKMITYIIGNHTLLIMGTHQLAIYAMTALVPALTGGTVIYGMLLLLGIAVFEMPVVWFIDRYLGIFIGKQTKRQG